MLRAIATLAFMVCARGSPKCLDFTRTTTQLAMPEIRLESQNVCLIGRLLCSRMLSHDLMNIRAEAYKYEHSDAPSRSMCWLNHMIFIIYILYTHNFYTMESQESPVFNYVLSVKVSQDAT